MSSIEAKLLHFETDGDIIHDFVESRMKKSAKLRSAIHACFYVQCVIASACIIIGILLCDTHFGTLFSSVAGVAVIVIAFLALGGEKPERIISCATNLVYAIVCLCVGGLALYICGALMLAAALAALGSVIAYHYRTFLLESSPLKIRSEHYTLRNGTAPCDVYIKKPEEEPAPPEPEKSELMAVAEQYMELFR